MRFHKALTLFGLCAVVVTVAVTGSALAQPSRLYLGTLESKDGVAEPIAYRTYRWKPYYGRYYRPSFYPFLSNGHRFRAYRDYYPFDPPYICIAWPWSTSVCVGRYEHPPY
jgi:hypothetical protein